MSEPREVIALPKRWRRGYYVSVEVEKREREGGRIGVRRFASATHSQTCLRLGLRIRPGLRGSPAVVVRLARKKKRGCVRIKSDIPRP